MGGEVSGVADPGGVVGTSTVVAAEAGTGAADCDGAITAG